MTRDDIIRMARECGDWNGQTCEMNDVGLERFATLVAAAEREACACLVERGTGDWMLGAKIARAIRARGES